jgi:hypothetical protein
LNVSSKLELDGFRIAMVFNQIMANMAPAHVLRLPLATFSSVRLLRRASLRFPPSSLQFHGHTVASPDATTPKQGPSVAVLFQAVEPPVINGVVKPKKPGGSFPLLKVVARLEVPPG